MRVFVIVTLAGGAVIVIVAVAEGRVVSTHVAFVPAAARLVSVTVHTAPSGIELIAAADADVLPVGTLIVTGPNVTPLQLTLNVNAPPAKLAGLPPTVATSFVTIRLPYWGWTIVTGQASIENEPVCTVASPFVIE